MLANPILDSIYLILKQLLASIDVVMKEAENLDGESNDNGSVSSSVTTMIIETVDNDDQKKEKVEFSEDNLFYFFLCLCFCRINCSITLRIV